MEAVQISFAEFNIVRKGAVAHRPRRSAAVGVPANRKMVNENFNCKQLL